VNSPPSHPSGLPIACAPIRRLRPPPGALACGA
jgi:hypothetical protein